VLIDSGLRHRTHEVIKITQEIKNKDPMLWQNIIDELGLLSLEAKKVWNSNFNQIGNLMNHAHENLRRLGVSNENLDHIVKDIKSRGALGAKLTGAGKGGYVLALFSLDKNTDIEKIISAKYPKENFLLWKP
jgi:mevalonate kinase